MSKYFSKKNQTSRFYLIVGFKCFANDYILFLLTFNTGSLTFMDIRFVQLYYLQEVKKQQLIKTGGIYYRILVDLLVLDFIKMMPLLCDYRDLGSWCRPTWRKLPTNSEYTLPPQDSILNYLTSCVKADLYLSLSILPIS